MNRKPRCDGEVACGTQFARDAAIAAMTFQRYSHTWSGGGGAPRGGSPVDLIAGGGMAVGSVAGARSRGARCRGPEEWQWLECQRLEAIKECKKLLREANEKHEKKRRFRLEARRAFQPHRRGLYELAGRRRRAEGREPAESGTGEIGADDSAGELEDIEIAMHADADGNVAHSFLTIETSGNFYWWCVSCMPTTLSVAGYFHQH